MDTKVIIFETKIYLYILVTIFIFTVNVSIFFYFTYVMAAGNVAVDSQGNIWTNSWKDHSSFLNKIANNGTWLAFLRDIEYPIDIISDKNGYLYVIDRDKKGIQKFNENGTFITSWGEQDGSSDDSARLGQRGLALDNQSNVYVLNPTKTGIQKFNENGTFITSWGKPITNASDIKGDEFDIPSGIAVDDEGNVYVGDISNFKIKKFTTNGTFIKEWSMFTENLNEASMQAIPQTMLLTFDSYDNLFVLDTGYGNSYATERKASIQIFTTNGTLISSLNMTDMENKGIFLGSGIDIDAKNSIYISAYPTQILKFKGYSK